MFLLLFITERLTDNLRTQKNSLLPVTLLRVLILCVWDSFFICEVIRLHNRKDNSHVSNNGLQI